MKTQLHHLRKLQVLLLFLVIGISISQKCFSQGDIAPLSETSFTGGSTVCQNVISQDLIFSFDTQTCGTSPFNAIDVTVTWFSNPINTTSGGNPVAQQTSTTSTTTFNYTPSTAVVGTLYYYVEVSWGTGTIVCTPPATFTSNETQAVIVNSLSPVDVTIGASAATICAGTSVTFTATPTNGGTSPTYQWKVNAVNAGTNSPTFTTNTLVNGDVVTVEMTSDLVSCISNNPATSNSINMTVNAPQPVSVTIGASATTICTGTSVTFTATPTNGGTSPTYQWKVNGINAGTNSPTFTTSTLANGDVVTVILTSDITPCATGNPATSNSIGMTVNPILPVSVTIGASATTICAGSSVTFTATPVNAGPSPSYQWKVNGSNVGTNSPTFTTTTLANGNIVTVILTTAAACTTGSPATSNPISMTVNPIPPAVVITPASATFCQGSIQSLSASSGASSTFSTGSINFTIPDNGANGVSNTLSVSGIPVGAVVNSVSVTFNINHTNVGDLVVNLKAPNANVLNLANRDGGTGDNFTNTIVSSTGAVTVSTGTAPFTATFLPDGIIGVGSAILPSTVAAFSSLFSTPNGNWVFNARDAVTGTTGTLAGWSITINWSYPITWTPITDLFSDAAATVPYTNGQVLATVYAKPAAAGSVTYTAIATHPNGCPNSNTVTLTVSPKPTVNATPTSQNVCTGSPITQIDITNPNSVAGTTFNWTRTTPAGLAGIAASGNGSSISGTFTNSTTAAITTTFTITATAGGCSSTTTVTVTVNPIPTVSATNTSQTVCGLITNIVITNPNNVSGTVLSWTRDNIVNLTGIAASGTGSPISGTFINNTAVQQTTVFTITASLAGCSSTTTATIAVNPKPTVNATPASQNVCTGSPITQIDITNPNSVPGTTFSWTRTTPAGLAGIANSGNGSSISGTFTNSTTAAITTTFTITATAGGCSSTTTVTVTVNPIPTVSATNTNQTVCGLITNMVITNPNNISGAVLSWTRDNTVNLTGIAASGTGSPIAGTFINNTNVQQTTIFTISASLAGCSTSTTATIKVNPTPTVSATPATQTICSATAIGQISATNPNAVASTNFTWTRDNTVNLTGMPASGSGAAINGTLTNTTAIQQTNIFTITATSGTCSSSTTVNVKVNPTPTVNAIANQAYCQNQNGAAVNFGSNVAGATFAWTSTADVGFGTSGNGNIPAYIATNSPITTTVSVTATASGCAGPVRTFTITINPLPSVTVTADYCVVPGKVRLTANPSPAGTYTYLWTTGAVTQIIDVDIAGLYGVTVTNSNGCKATNSIQVATELAVNGTFEAGNSGFTSGYTYDPSANGLFSPEGKYAVNNNPNFNHNNFWGSDHTTGAGKMMIINGVVGPTVWQETVTVVPNTTYYFSAWALSMNNVSPFAQLQFSVNGSPIGVSAVLVAGVNNTASNTNWQRFYGVWSSGALSTATCSIVDLQGALGGNDFALDDISISTLSPAPFFAFPSIVGGGASICQGSTLNLSSNLSGGSSAYTFSWTGPGGFTSNQQNPTIPAATAANSGSYTITATDFYGCITTGSRTITVDAPPAAPSPVTATPATVCLGSSSNLNGTTPNGTQSDFTGFYAPASWTTTNNPPLTGGSVNLSGLPTAIAITSGNNGIANGNTDYTVTNGPVAGNFTFNWSYTTEDGPSRDIPQYSINGGAAVNLPGFNTAGANTQTGTASIAVPANQTFALRMRTTTGTLGAATTTFYNFAAPITANISWYNVPAAGTTLGTTNSGANFSVTPAGIGANNYYAQAISGIGCVSTSRTLVTVTVNQPSTAATGLNASPSTICNGGSSTLTQTGGTLGTGASWKWYSNNTYTTLVGTGTGTNASLIVSPVITTTYYLRIEGTSSPCTANVTGPAAGVTVTVNQPTVPPTTLNASVNPICKGNSTTLTQSGGTIGTGATWKWYSDASYTTFVGNGVGATASLSVSPLVTTTYYLRSEGGSAPCTATIAGPVAGVTVTVNQPSVAATGLNASPSTICNGGSSTLTQTGGTLGTGASWKWYSNNTYTTLVGTGTGATASLTVSPVVTTTYYLRIEGAASPCTANVTGPAAGVTVTVNQPTIVPTTLNASVNPICKGNSTTLTQSGGTIGTGATWKWYSDASYTTFVGNGVGATASLSVSPLVTTTYYLRSEGGSAPCTATIAGPVAGVTVTVNQPSVAATGLTASPSAICNGGSSTLTQTGGTLGTGASWQWYSNNTYTTLVGTGTGATASLTVSPVVTTTYYLRIEGAASPCTANVTGPAAGVTVTVNQPSVAATGLNASPATICEGTSSTLTQTGGSLGTGATWKWYSDASYTTFVGNGVGATASLSVSPLVTTTYYLRSEGGASPCAVNVTGPVAGVTVTVNKKSANPTSIVAAPATICEGSSTTLTLSGGGAGTGETIAWYTGSCGGTLVGTGNNLVVNPAVTTTYYGRYEDSDPCNFNSTCLQVTVNVTVTGTWLGINTNWNNPANWCGGVPTTLTNVNIPLTGSGFYPLISSAVAMAHDITIASGATVTVNNHTLQISGAIINNGTFDVGNGTLELNGSGSAQNIAGSMFAGKAIHNLRISNSSGVNFTGVNDTLKLSGVLKFGVSNATLNTNNNLTLLSDAMGTGSIGDMTNNGANSNNHIIGNATVERYIPNHFKAWQFLAVPTSGQTVNAAWQESNTPLSNSNNPGHGTIITSNVPGAVALGFDVYTPAGPTMKSYDSTTNGWLGIASPGIQIANKKGYMLFVRGDRSVTTSSAPATATILRTTGKLYTTDADAPPSTNLDAGTFESIGNPYASAIDFNAVTKTGGVQDIFYVWDPKLTTSTYSAWGLGAYQTIIGPGPNYIVVPGGGSYSGTNTNIESGQAFFVHAPFAPGTVSFTETCKVDGSFTVTRPSNTDVKQLRNNLYVIAAGNPILLDGTLSQFDASFSNSIDEMDAVKMNNNSENLGLMRDGKKLVAERRAEIQSTDTIYYNTGQLRVQQYMFEFIPSYLDQQGILAFLEDKYLHTSTVLSMQDTSRVLFNIINDPGSYAADRFRVVFNRPGPVPVTFTSIAANRNSDKTATVNWKVENEMNIQRYAVERSTDGRNFTGILTAEPTANNGGGAVYSKNDLGALSADNFYRIKSISVGGGVQYSAVVKVGPVKSAPGVTVYPNPVTGHAVQLQFVDQPVGKYNIVLIYSNGQQQQLAQVQISVGQTTHSIELPQLLAAGIYRLQITGPGNTTILKTINVSAE